MVTLKYIKGDWVKEKNGTEIMQIDDYQIVDIIAFEDGNLSLPTTKRVYNGKVWCTWTNKNKAVITQPFWEADLEPVSQQVAAPQLQFELYEK